MEKKVLKFFNKYKIDPNGKDMTALEEKMQAMNNQINGISPKDRNIGKYMHAARGIAKYLDNQITDEILYWNCK